MSVLIKGVEMPTDCVYCKWHTRWGCGITGIRTNTAQGCPLIEVPTPHGRLIDADAFRRRAAMQAAGAQLGMIRHANDNEQGKWLTTLTERAGFVEDIDRAPTIIEAEEEP